VKAPEENRPPEALGYRSAADEPRPPTFNQVVAGVLVCACGICSGFAALLLIFLAMQSSPFVRLTALSIVACLGAELLAACLGFVAALMLRAGLRLLGSG
jgi:hypothetical protein